MKINYYIAALLLLFVLMQNNLFAHNPKSSASAPNSGFIANNGQWLNPSHFLINLNSTQVFVEPHALQYFFENPEDVDHYFSHQFNPHLFKAQPIRQHAVRVDFLNSSPATTLKGQQAYPHYYNFFQGNNPQTWKGNVSVFQSVYYSNLYNGVDMRLYTAEQNGLKYDLIIAPNTATSAIAIKYSGADELKIKSGNLVVKTSVNTFTEHKPYAYQYIDNKEVEVTCAFVLEQNIVKFALGEYNKNYPLIIDPLLVFSTYSGSSVDNFGHTATYDNSGNLYAAGIARNPTTFPNGKYPVTAGAFQTIWGGGDGSWPQEGFPTDISISKYNNDGTQLLYATYIGGNRNEYPISLVVDGYEQLTMLGATLSSNYPIKSGAYQPNKADTFDIVVTRFTASGGGLVGSTYFGGNGVDGINTADTLLMNYADEFRGEIQLAQGGDVWIVSSTGSSNLNTTSGATQGSKNGEQDGIICRFDSTLSQLKACSYLGSEKHDALYSLDVFANGDIVVAGGTQSLGLPATVGYFSPQYHGGISDGFIAKFNNTLTLQKGMRYWGGSKYDQAYFVKLDQAQNIVVMGQTYDSVYATGGVYRTSTGSLFITKFSSTLSLVLLSTQIGNTVSNNALSPSAFMVDVCGKIYGSVWGGNTNYNSRYRTLHPTTFFSSTGGLPVTSDAYRANTDNADFYLFVLSANADSIKYGTYFGENNGADHVDGGTSRFDKRGVVYQSVCASCAYGTSGAFPTTPTSYSPKNKSPRCSNASFKFDFRQNNVLIADFKIEPRNVCGNKRVAFTNQSHNANKNYWYINNILVDSTVNLTDSFTTIGTYTVKLKITNSTTCNTSDSITKTFVVSNPSKASLTVKQDSCGPDVYIKGNATVGNNLPAKYLWQFGDGDTSTQSLDHTYQYAANGTYTITLIANPGDVCADTASSTIIYNAIGKNLKADFTPLDNIKCQFYLFSFKNNSENGKRAKWYVNESLVSESNIGFDTIVDVAVLKVKLVIYDSTTCKSADSVTRVYYAFKELYPVINYLIDSCSLGVQFGQLTNNPNNDSVPTYWEFGDGATSRDKAPFHHYTDTGWYDVKLTLNKGLICESTTTQRIHLILNSRAILSRFDVIPNPLCSPQKLQTSNKSFNASKWYWLVNNVIKDSVNYDYTDSIIQPQPYTLSLVTFNANTCKLYDTLHVPITIAEGAKAAFEVTRDKCSPFLNIINNSLHTTPTTTYFWDFGDGTTSTLQTPFYLSTLDTTLNIKLIVNPGTVCADTVQKTFYYRANSHLLSADFNLNDSTLCLPAFVSATSTGTNGQHFTWFINSVLVDSTQKQITDTFRIAGKYELKLVVTDTNSCLGVDSVIKHLEANEHTEADFIMQRDSCSLEVMFKNTSSNLNVNRIWYLGDGDSSTENLVKHQYKNTDTYTILLITSPGTFCADTAKQIHYIDGDTTKEVFVPNVFTPNNDGINDCYKITGVNPKCDFYQIVIYNRWGNKVYENTDGNICWDGNSQSGEPLPAGVYYYILKLIKQNGLSRDENGTITLIRDEKK